MKITSVSTNNHRILGTVKINFFGDSESVDEKLFDEKQTDLVLTAESNQTENHYTYIIGDNAVGKTVLLKSLIFYINNSFRYFADKTLIALNKLYKDGFNKYNYNSMYGSDLTENVLESLNVKRKIHTKPDGSASDFLFDNDAQLLFISSVFDKKIIHQSDRFRSYNYLTKINNTKILFQLAFLKLHNTENVDLLNGLLESPNAKWEIKYGLAYDQNSYNLNFPNHRAFKATNKLNVYKFIDLIDKISIMTSGELDSDKLSSNNVKDFEMIYGLGSFVKLLHSYEGSLADFFDEIRTGRVVSSMRDFLNKFEKPTNLDEQYLIPIKIDIDQYFISYSTGFSLTEFDILLLGMLEDLGIMDSVVKRDDTLLEDLSSGEQSIVRLFSFFADLPLKNQNRNLLVFFDEPENSLHPKWQQSFPENFKLIVEKIYGITGSHFIFSTHSPLIIMKSPLTANSNVIRIYKNDKREIATKQITDVNSYSIEEVLLDEFKISYRDKGLESSVRALLALENDKMKNGDPIHSIESSITLREKINQLFNSLNN